MKNDRSGHLNCLSAGDMPEEAKTSLQVLKDAPQSPTANPGDILHVCAMIRSRWETSHSRQSQDLDIIMVQDKLPNP